MHISLQHRPWRRWRRGPLVATVLTILARLLGLAFSYRSNCSDALLVESSHLSETGRLVTLGLDLGDICPEPTYVLAYARARLSGEPSCSIVHLSFQGELG